MKLLLVLHAEIQQLGIGEATQIRGTLEGFHQRRILQMNACNGFLLEHSAYDESLLNLCGHSLHIPIDIVQGVFKEAAAVVKLHNKAALHVPSVADAAGVGIYADCLGLCVHAQNADIFKLLFQLLYKRFRLRTSGIQEFRKSHNERLPSKKSVRLSPNVT